MEFQIIQTDPEMIALAGDWNTLLDNSAIHVPFLRHEYLQIWWNSRGGGEWPEAKLHIITARRDGNLVGIAPLFQAKNRDGIPALLLLGSIEISDYLDVIARPEDLLEFMNGLLTFLAQEDKDNWTVLDWYNVLDSSATLPTLEKEANQRGWTYQADLYEHSPLIYLPGDWDTYLSSIDKKQRHEIRRKMRRAEENEVAVTWHFSSEKTVLDRDIDAFFDLMRQDEEKERFLTPAMQDQMRATIHCAFDAGCLQLAFLEVGGEKAAAYLNFDYLNRIWVYNSGIDSRFREVSPGWVLLGYLLEWANLNKREAFDFLRGSEDYKYRFGAKDQQVMRLRVQRT